MASQFSVRHTVQFSETDMAGIVHFSNFFRYMELAEHAFYRSLDLSVMPLPHEGDSGVGWPRVHASADYRAPLFFEEEFTIELAVEEVRSKSMRFRFRFVKEGGVLAATGGLAVAAVQKDPEKHAMKAVAIPDRFRDVIEPASAEVLATFA